MASIPGYCDHCKKGFEFPRGVVIEGGGVVVMENNVTSCPRCGRRARLLDGKFTEREGELEMISGPALSREVLEQLRDIAERAKSKEITAQQAVAEAEVLNPALGRLMKLATHPSLGGVGLIASVVGLYLQYQSSVSTAEFEAETLRMLERQTHAVEMLAELEKKKRDESVDAKRANPTKPKARSERKATKPPKKPKPKARDIRRQERLAHRKSFQPR